MLIELMDRFRKRDRRALARVITIIEKDSPLKEEVLKNSYFSAGRAKIIGLTGSPGAGKSSLIDQMVDFIRGRGETVGVIAVDPTSPFSGGALLGDRIRMQKHGLDEGVYIRSMGTRGNLGGLARSTKDVVRVLDAFGYDCIIVETVGVGQAEVDIMNVAHTTVLVMTPNTGDGIQTIKAGIMEIADLFVVNKSDLPGADGLSIEIETMLNMRLTEMKWRPPVIKTSALNETGVETLMHDIETHGNYLRDNGLLSLKEREKAGADTLEILDIRWKELVGRHLTGSGPVGRLYGQVLRQEMDPYTAADEIMDHFIKASRRGKQIPEKA